MCAAWLSSRSSRSSSPPSSPAGPWSCWSLAAAAAAAAPLLCCSASLPILLLPILLLLLLLLARGGSAANAGSVGAHGARALPPLLLLLLLLQEGLARSILTEGCPLLPRTLRFLGQMGRKECLHSSLERGLLFSFPRPQHLIPPPTKFQSIRITHARPSSSRASRCRPPAKQALAHANA